MMVSVRRAAPVAEWRILSISSLIDASFSMNVSVLGTYASLIVVVVAHEVADGVVGEEQLQLVVELHGQKVLLGAITSAGRLSSAIHVRHREGLPGPGDPEQGLRSDALAHALGQLADRLGLISLRRDLGAQPKTFDPTLHDRAIIACRLPHHREHVLHGQPLSDPVLERSFRTRSASPGGRDSARSARPAASFGVDGLRGFAAGPREKIPC
jgi:hypothetical protein